MNSTNTVKMRYRAYIVSSIVVMVLLMAPPVFAGFFQYLPFPAKEYTMYRVYPCKNLTTLKEEEEVARINRKKEQLRRNCLEWKAMLPASVSYDDICTVLYNTPYLELKQIFDKKEYEGENTMLRYLVKGTDQELLNYLLFAKKVEEIRGHINSAWYYPTMVMPNDFSHEGLLQEALNNHSKKLRPRYLLQAFRLLFDMRKYEQCIELWDKECVHWSRNLLMREMIEDYVVGARFRLHAETLDTKYLAEIDDAASLLFCAKLMGKDLNSIERIKYLYENIPSSQHFDKLFFECMPCIHDKEEAQELVNFAERCVKKGKLSNPALWYYTIAYLKEIKLSDSKGALKAIKEAESAKGTKYIQDSIKILRIYLDTKVMPYGTEYEEMLSQHLRWIDKKIQQTLTNEIKEKPKDGFVSWAKISFFYWDDMLRRIIIEVVTPKLLQNGNVVRALQVTNMAENMVKKYSGTYPIKTYSKEKGSDKVTRHWNYEYRTEYAYLLYKLSPQQVVAYLARIKHPQGDFDRFLNQRGFTDPDYLNDIIGTKYLANAEYKLAKQYLSKVSPAFRGVLNSEEYYVSDPFSWSKTPRKSTDSEEYYVDNPFSWSKGPRKGTEKGYFKLNFANEMLFLQDAIDRTSNPNTKASLMITYATGMRNSVGRSWPLTGYEEEYLKLDEKERKKSMSAGTKYLAIIENALALMTDKELLASTQYALGNYKTVAESYPETAMGKIVRGSCDNLVNDHFERKIR